LVSAFIQRNVIQRIITIEGQVVVISPLRVGAGKSAISPGELARDVVLKDSTGRPVIPGSSWKGVFRSAGERILNSKGVKVCTGIGRDICLRNYGKYEDFQRFLKSDIRQAIDTFWKYTCLNCKLFGTMSVSGMVNFLDSLPIDYKLNVRTMVAISRTEGASARSALVQVEYVEPNSKFEFKLMGRNLPNYVVGYLLTIMKNIHDGLTQIGGHKTRGFGFVKFGNLKLTISGDPKIGEEDKEVPQGLNNVQGEGDDFFNKVKPYMEVFQNVKIPYPVSG